MKKMNFILSLLGILILYGCNPGDDNVPTDEKIKRNGKLIFGWFSDSNCAGDCSDIYKIDNGKIYKDIDNNYPENTFFGGNFQLMTNVDFQNYEVLLVELPNEIFDEPNGYLDCSECTNADGGFYLEFKNDDGFHNSWRFRNALYPDYMENYRSLLISKLAEFNSL